jgi:phage tail sheath protein FI
MAGDDGEESIWKYVSVRRLFLFIEESVDRGTSWTVFEPNNEPLWAKLRQSITAFMDDLFRKGAFQGASAQDAYFVKCDNTTTSESDIEQGKVNILIGFAPLRPAEFVILKIQQDAGT